MKNQIANSNKPAQLHVFNSRLAAYSATATAVCLIAPAAEATIQNISSPTLSYTFSSGQSYNPNLAPFHGAIVGSVNVFSANSFRGYAALQSGHFLRTVVGSHRNALDLSKSAAISGANWGNYAQLAVKSHTTFNRSVGQFLPGINGVKTGYVGFKTVQNAQTYYGWLRVKVTGDAHGLVNQISLVAIDGIVGAYDAKSDISSDVFTAGSIAAVPEPSVAALGGLALLACGAAGVREQRRRRQAAAKTN